MKKYRIYAGGDAIEIERILTILFKHGYVFTGSRIRTMELVRKQWTNENFSYWNWIVTAFDDECKAIMSAIGDSRDTVNYIEITLEDFLKLK